MSSSEKESKKGKSLKPSRKVTILLAVLFAVATTIFASIIVASTEVCTSINAASSSVFQVLFAVKADDLAAVNTINAATSITCYVLFVLSCLVSYSLVYYILRSCKAQKRTASLMALIPITAPIVLSFFTGGFGAANWLIMVAAVLCVAACLFYDFLKEKYPKIFKSMAVSYIFFGALTTAVNYIVHMILLSYGWWYEFAVAGSFVCAVIFAYVVNKLFVFKSDTDTKEELFREAGLFFAMRLISFAAELIFSAMALYWFHWPEAPVKLSAMIIVLVSNYFFSKMKVFVKRKDAKPAEDADDEEPKLLNEKNDKKD